MKEEGTSRQSPNVTVTGHGVDIIKMNLEPIRNLHGPFKAVSEAVERFIAAEQVFSDLDYRYGEMSADCHVLTCYIDGIADDDMLQWIRALAETRAIFVAEDDVMSFEDAQTILEEFGRELDECYPALSRSEQEKEDARRTLRRVVGSALLLAKRTLRKSTESTSAAHAIVPGEAHLPKCDVEEAYGRLRQVVRTWLADRQRMKNAAAEIGKGAGDALRNWMNEQGKR
jgi:hypothetical protein